MPEDVACARAGEVADARALKVARVDPEVDAAGPLGVVDQPSVGVARRGIVHSRFRSTEPCGKAASPARQSPIVPIEGSKQLHRCHALLKQPTERSAQSRLRGFAPSVDRISAIK